MSAHQYCRPIHANCKYMKFISEQEYGDKVDMSKMSRYGNKVAKNRSPDLFPLPESTQGFITRLPWELHYGLELEVEGCSRPLSQRE